MESSLASLPSILSVIFALQSRLTRPRSSSPESIPRTKTPQSLATLDATIYTTALFNLPAGGVGFAFGGQFRRESLKEEPDMLNVEGDIVGNSPVPSAEGGRKTYAFYAETRIPIFSPVTSTYSTGDGKNPQAAAARPRQ